MHKHSTSTGRAVAIVLSSIFSVAYASAAPASAPVAGFSFVRSLGGIEEYRLDSNGLQVLIKPDHSAPVATFNVVYRVGSRNEVTGTTGATHLLEHLMFKGSDAFNDGKGNSLDQYLERVGGSYNAMTSQDRTNYFATVGRAALEDYMAIEADRMRNIWLRDSDRQAEMTVVRNEYERGKNNPRVVLMEEVSAAAYQALPYHHSTIGWKSDIENVPIEKLRAFYDTFYWPNNATAILVGDVDVRAALTMIQKHFGNYARSPEPIPQIYTEEPEQTGPRRVTVKQPGQLGTVMIAHKVPSGRDADTAPLTVLNSILIEGKSSRLYKAMVDAGLATEVDAYHGANFDQSLNMLMVNLAPDTQHEKAERTLLAEVERVKRDGVTAAEVSAAVRRFLVQQALWRDGTNAVAFALSEYVSIGDWTLYVTLEEGVARVTPADVQRVAQKYLNEDQSTTGWYVPIVPEAGRNAAAGS
jgi:zinc protease